MRLKCPHLYLRRMGVIPLIEGAAQGLQLRDDVVRDVALVEPPEQAAQPLAVVVHLALAARLLRGGHARSVQRAQRRDDRLPVRPHLRRSKASVMLDTGDLVHRKGSSICCAGVPLVITSQHAGCCACICSGMTMPQAACDMLSSMTSQLPAGGKPHTCEVSTLAMLTFAGGPVGSGGGGGAAGCGDAGCCSAAAAEWPPGMNAFAALPAPIPEEAPKADGLGGAALGTNAVGAGAYA